MWWRWTPTVRMPIASVSATTASVAPRVGRKLQPGESARDFTLDQFDPTTGTMRQVHLADSAGTVRLHVTLVWSLPSSAPLAGHDSPARRVAVDQCATLMRRGSLTVPG